MLHVCVHVYEVIYTRMHPPIHFAVSLMNAPGRLNKPSFVLRASCSVSKEICTIVFMRGRTGEGEGKKLTRNPEIIARGAGVGGGGARGARHHTQRHISLHKQ